MCYNSSAMNKKHFPLCVAVLTLLSQCVTQQVEEPPVAQCLPAEFCYLDEVVPGIRTDLKYAGNDNFVGRRIVGYSGCRALLRKDAALALKKADAALAKKGYGILVWDAYRPLSAMKDFYQWSQTSDNRMQTKFYPNITKRGIYEGRYIGENSEHTWGIALDLTLVDRKSGRLVDMGGHHDFLDPSSATASSAVTSKQSENRRFLRESMEQAGFENYDKEWWHYRLRDSRPWYAYDFQIIDHLLPTPDQAQ